MLEIVDLGVLHQEFHGQLKKRYQRFEAAFLVRTSVVGGTTLSSVTI